MMNNGMRILRGELQIPSTAELLADASTLEVPDQPVAPEAMTWQKGLGRLARQASGALAASLESAGRLSSGDGSVMHQMGRSPYTNNED
jgi:hypothetical protein